MQPTTSWPGPAPARVRVAPPGTVVAAMVLMLVLGVLLILAGGIFAVGVATAKALHPSDALTMVITLGIGVPLAALAVPVYRGNPTAWVASLVVTGLALVGALFLVLLAVAASSLEGGPSPALVALVLTALIVLFGLCVGLGVLLFSRSARRYFQR